MTPKNVLIVEDESITARYIEGVLTQLGVLKITIAVSATEALELITHTKFDLILMDINIKGPMDGIQVAKAVLDHHAIPIIFITAYTDKETLDSIYELVPYGFIRKPFTPKDLEIAVSIGYSRFKLEQNQTQTIKTNKVKLASEFYYCLDGQQLLKNGECFILNNKQSKLLYILVKNQNSNVSHEQLTQSVWENKPPPSDSSLRTLVYSIRKIAPALTLITSSKNGYMIQSVV